EIGLYAIVGVGGALTIRDRETADRVRERHEDRRRRVVEIPRAAEVAAALPSGLGAGEDGVAHTARLRDADDVGLVEHVQPRGRVVVGAQRDARPVRGGRARYVVLIPAIVVADDAAVSNREAGDVMLDGGAGEIHIGAHVAVRRVAEERRDRDVRGPAAVRRDAAVGDAPVV